MRALQLNLAHRPFRNNTLVWVAYVALLALGAWFTYWNVSSFRHHKRELAELDQIQGNMQQEQGDLVKRHRGVLKGVGAYDRTAIARRTGKANQVIEWKAFSWTRLFNRLEELLPHTIRMVSISPVFRDRDRNDPEDDPRRSIPITIEGLARDWNGFFELETVLINDESFGRVLPRHIDKMENGELSFSMKFDYFPDELSPAPEPAEEVAEAVPDEAPEVRADVPPPADPVAGEVTDDEWAAHTQKDDSAVQVKETTQRPARRTLPEVQPETETDDEGQPR